MADAPYRDGNPLSETGEDGLLRGRGRLPPKVDGIRSKNDVAVSEQLGALGRSRPDMVGVGFDDVAGHSTVESVGASPVRRSAPECHRPSTLKA